MGVCTNKQEKLAIDLLRKLNLYKYFEYVAGCDTFSFNKPDPRHLTNVVEIIGGDLKRTMMVGDSEVDANSAHNANLPFVLVKDGYTEKSEKEIKHNESITDLSGLKIIENIYDYLLFQRYLLFILQCFLHSVLIMQCLMYREVWFLRTLLHLIGIPLGHILQIV